MSVSNKLISIVSGLILFLLIITCTEIKYDNPYDPDGTYEGRPVIELKGPDTMLVVFGGDYKEPGFILKDDKDDQEELEERIKIYAFDKYDNPVDTNDIPKKKGEYTIKYRLKDSDKKSAEEKIRMVSVVDKESIKDTIAPVIELKGGTVKLNLGDEFEEPGYTAIDDPGNEDITEDVERAVKNEDGIPENINDFYNKEGKYRVSYDVSDLSGNKAETKERKVEVGPDVEPPVITLKGSSTITLIAGESYIDSGATATDNVDGDLTSEIDISGEVDTLKTGTYKITYTVSDKAGNEASKDREVIVKPDEIPPVITLKGDNPMIVEFGNPYDEPGATATDDIDGNLTSEIDISGVVNTSKVDTYTVNYTVSDEAGNEAEKDRIVIVRDTVHPVIYVNPPNPYNITVGNPYVEKGATAWDNADDTLTSELDTSGDVNTSVAGTYEITYSVSDKSGNKTDSIRIVNVSDIIPASIVEHPQNTEVNEEYFTAFEIKAIGTSLTYQWKQKVAGSVIWETITGAASNIYTIRASLDMDGSEYKCCVTGYNGSVVESNTATLSVIRSTNDTQ